MEKQLAVIELPQELEVLNTPNLGLSKDKATEHLLAFAPFMTQLTELSSGLESINFTEPSDDDSKKAREIRLAMVRFAPARRRSRTIERSLFSRRATLFKARSI